MNGLQLRVLYRQFLFRLFDLEVLSAQAQGDANKLLGQFAALLVFVSVTLALGAILSSDSNLPSRNSSDNGQVLVFAMTTQHFLIATTMLVVGLFAVLSWDATFPDRRDVLVLAPLPVRARTMFIAKLAAVATSLALTILLLHSAMGLVWPLAFAGQAAPAALPALTLDATPAPLTARDLEAVMDRDLRQQLTIGQLAPGKGAGLVIGVSKHGERRVFTYGTAQPDSLFEIGSISKTFTGLMLAQMVVEGTVRLDTPVRKLLPPGTVAQPPDPDQEITLLDLATHHSGLPPMPNNFRPADRSNPYADYGPQQLYAYVAKHGLAKPADATFLYSNLGVGLLGQALAVRAGRSYAEQLHQEITGPLGMTNTVVTLSGDQQRRFMQGYDEKHRPVHAWDLDGLVGAGGIRSTAGDMLTYLEANLHPEKYPALSGALASSHRPRESAASGGRIALAWLYYLDSETYRHGGATAGFTSHAFFNPKADCAAVVLVNSGPNPLLSPDMIGEHIRQRLSGEPAISLDTVLVPATQGFPGRLALLRRLLVHDAGRRRVCLWSRPGDARARTGTAAAAVPSRLGISAIDSHWRHCRRLLSATRLRRIGRPHHRLYRPSNSVASVILLSGAIPAIERITASSFGADGAKSLDSVGRSPVSDAVGLYIFLLAYVAQDRRGTRYHARLAAIRLVTPIREPGANRHRAIQRTHPCAQQTASPDSRVLSRMWSRFYLPSAEGIRKLRERSTA